MPISTKIFASVVCVILAVIVFELVRKKKIREEYSLIWLASSVVVLACVVFDGVIVRIIHFLGGVNPASFFFFGGIFFSIMLLLNLTVRISELKQKQNVLIQEMGLVKERIDGLEPMNPDDRE